MWRYFIILVFGNLACSHDRKPLRVYAFMSTECPLCAEQTGPLMELKDKFGNQVEFRAVFPNEDDTPSLIEAFNEKYRFDFSYQRDKTQHLAETLGATVTPQVFLVNDRSSVLYRGQINNRMISLGKKRKVVTAHYLQDAIRQALSGSTISVVETDPVGCTIFHHVTTCGH